MRLAIRVSQSIAHVSRAVARKNISNSILKNGYSTRSIELQKQIDFELKRGGDANRLKESLCVAYIKEKNVEKVEELTKTGTFAEAIYHDIINMHIDLGNTELALNHFERIRSIRPTFKLTRKDAGRLGHLMFKEDREWSEIIRVFIENRQQPIRSDDWNTKEIHFFLEAVANTRNPGELSELFDVLHANNFLIKDSHVAGFMIKAHLKNEDLPNAVGTFEKQFAENKFTSNYLPLMVALLVANDMEGLEKVFKCMQLKYSNGDAVLALVTAFIEIGNLELARVVLNHSASLITDNDFRQHCARCSMFGRHAMLENLISATEGLGYDRSIIYSSLLAHYCAKNQVDQALELWRRQISKNEEPSNDFMIALASCLKKNSLNVPFEVPKPKLKQEEGAGKNAAARSEKVDAALKRWEIAYPKSVRYIYLTSNLYQSLSESKEAAVTEIKLIQVKRRVFDDALRDLVLRLDNDGEIELLERLGNALPTPAKRSIHFGLLLLKAYEKADKWDEFFSLTLAKKRKNLNINDRIPMEDLLVRLQKQSIPLNQFELFAEDAADEGAYQPLNILWAHYFLGGSPKSGTLHDRLENLNPKKFETAFVASYLVRAGEDRKLESLHEFARAKCEEQMPVINIVSLIARLTKK